MHGERTQPVIQIFAAAASPASARSRFVLLAARILASGRHASVAPGLRRFARFAAPAAAGTAAREASRRFHPEKIVPFSPASELFPDAARPARPKSRPRSWSSSKKLRLEHGLRHLRAIHSQELETGANRKFVNQTGDRVFPRSTLSQNEHGHIGFCHQRRLRPQLLHDQAGADEETSLAERLDILGWPIPLRRCPSRARWRWITSSSSFGSNGLTKHRSAPSAPLLSPWAASSG